ncbi:hypothetical protein, partial [Campylobacter geochelonis]
MAKEIILTVEELMNPKIMTNLFLYGEKTKPNNDRVISEEFIDRKGNGEKYGVIVKILPNEISKFMNTYGRFANASQTAVVKEFFDNSSLKPGIYARNDIVISNDKGEYNHSYKDMFFKGSDKEEWARRLYILNSQSFTVNSFAKFIVNKDGTKHIENLTMIPYYDNFDFDSGSLVGNIGNNLYLKDDIDPYKIGKTVSIQYPSSSELQNIHTNSKIYTFADYENDKRRYNEEHSYISPADMLTPILNISDELWNSGVTKFIDNEGKVIIYGTNSSDVINRISSSARHLYEYYLKNKDKGVVIIAGKDGDKILGSVFGNDILYSSGSISKEDNYADELRGFSGFDTYYVGDKDIIEDSDGIGMINFNGITLKGAKLEKGSTNRYKDKEGNTYIRKEDGFKYEGKDGKTLTVNSKFEENTQSGVITYTTLGVVLNDNDIVVNVSNPTQQEVKGYIEFIISLDEVSSKDLTFRLKSIKGSATETIDYEAVDKLITI